MAYQGWPIIDCDTHVQEPNIDIIDRYLDHSVRPAFEAVKDTLQVGRDPRQNVPQYKPKPWGQRRPLGSPRGTPVQEPYPWPASWVEPPSADCNSNPHSRIRDMDREGVDVCVIFPSTMPTFSALTPELEVATYRAYHRWLTEDYCAPYPDRMKAALMLSLRDVKTAVAEMQRWGKEPWAVAILPTGAPDGLLVDDPSFRPIWEAAQDLELTVIFHTFTFTYPYPPGATEMGDNQYLATLTAHPWNGMRNVGALIGGAVMELFPRLRVGLVEAGVGWLPWWIARMDDRIYLHSHSLPLLTKPPSTYFLSGRYFQTFEITEPMVGVVAEQLGDDLLVYGSDYPHGQESYFPESVKKFLARTDLSESQKRKLLFDNALRFYPRLLPSVERLGLGVAVT